MDISSLLGTRLLLKYQNKMLRACNSISPELCSGNTCLDSSHGCNNPVVSVPYDPSKIDPYCIWIIEESTVDAGYFIKNVGTNDYMFDCTTNCLTDAESYLGGTLKASFYAFVIGVTRYNDLMRTFTISVENGRLFIKRSIGIINPRMLLACDECFTDQANNNPIVLSESDRTLFSFEVVDSGGANAGMVIGIVIGIFIVLGSIGLFVWWMLQRKRKHIRNKVR